MSSPPHPAGGPDGGVEISDRPLARVRHPGDLVSLALTLIGVAVLLVLAVYAHSTTTGLTEDVQGFASLVRRVLFIPVAVLESLLTLIAPIVVMLELVFRRLFRVAAEAAAAAVLGVLVALGVTWLIRHSGTDEIVTAFSVWSRSELTRVVTIPPLLAGVAALLTAAGPRGQRRSIGASWNLLWIALGVALITGLVTLPGALMTVLAGRATGLTLRYVFGVHSERAYGPALVAGLHRAGFAPARLVRAGLQGGPEAAAAQDAAVLAITRYTGNRVYVMTTTEGEVFDVLVFDGDRQVVGMLTWFWRSLRFRGIDGRAIVSLRQAAERAALLTHTAWSAGVSTRRLLGMAEAEDSMILVQEHIFGAVPLRDLPTSELDDATLAAIWEQLQIAHRAGLAHRSLTPDVILVAHADDGAPRVHLVGWQSGDVASSDLARRLDISHLLAVLALKVGARRAMASAAAGYTDEQLTAVGPLLQSIALPRATREEFRKHPGLLAALREALIARVPRATVHPERLARFGPGTVILIVLTIAAAVIVITRFNFQEIAQEVQGASLWWALATYLLGLTAFFGAAIALVAFAPVKLSLWRTTLVQAAGAFVALVAPAGVGPAAINVRMLARRRVSNTLAGASVGLVQLSQFITTVVLLLVISLVSGRESALQLPSATVLAAFGVVVLAVALALLIPPLRQWVGAKLLPIWRATWPRLIQMLSQPRRFAVAAVGNVLVTLSYIGAFYASLAAFGVQMSLIDLALIYLLGNAAGAVVPTPGGLGAVEGALVGALTTTGGVPLAIATSVVVLFRALTYWGRVPVGWLAMRSLQKSGDL